MISHYGNKDNPAYSNKLSLIRWFIDFWYNSCNLGTPCIILVEGKKPLLKTLIAIGKKRKLDYIKLFKINVCLDLHSYPLKIFEFFSLFSTCRTWPELWDNDKLSTDQTKLNSALCPNESDDRSSGEQFTSNTINNKNSPSLGTIFSTDHLRLFTI